MGFKEGDRVRVRMDLELYQKCHMEKSNNYESVNPLVYNYLLGETLTIDEVMPYCYYCKETANVRFTDEMLVALPYDPTHIAIWQDGRKVIAVNTDTGKRSEARCRPDDTFDFRIGAMLALQRLLI